MFSSASPRVRHFSVRVLCTRVGRSQTMNCRADTSRADGREEEQSCTQLNAERSSQDAANLQHSPLEELPPPVFTPWPVVVGLASVAIAIAYADRTNIAVAILPMGNEFDWSKTTQGGVLSAFFAGYAATQLLGGQLADRLGGHVVLGTGTLTLYMRCVKSHFSSLSLRSCILERCDACDATRCKDRRRAFVGCAHASGSRGGGCFPGHAFHHLALCACAAAVPRGGLRHRRFVRGRGLRFCSGASVNRPLRLAGCFRRFWRCGAPH